MHELSVAIALLELAGREVPPGAVLKGVHVTAGPLRAIEPEAMRFAWQAVVADAGMSDVDLHLEIQPWRLQCPRCGASWTSIDLDATCGCGQALGYPVGGDELRLVSIEVDDAIETEASNARLSGEKRAEAQRRGRRAEPPGVPQRRRVRHRHPGRPRVRKNRPD